MYSTEKELVYTHLEGRNVGIIGVSVKEGQNLEGPETAPGEIRAAGLLGLIEELGWSYNDYNDIVNENIEMKESFESVSKQHKYSTLKHAHILGATCQKLSNFTKKIAASKSLCLTLGGDHGLATGSIHGVKSVYPNLKIIWVDAHADINLPEDSPSGNYHGMPVAHLLGWIAEGEIPGFDWFKPCLKKEDIVFIGLRDLDTEEKKNLRKHNIKCFTMDDILRFGMGGVMQQTFEYLNPNGESNPIHISFDIDAVDPSIAYGTGTKSRGGLLSREAHFIVREAVASGNLVSMDLVEVNPMLDRPQEHFHGDFQNINGTETVVLGIGLIASALGHTLL